jgi:hypothetical protein
MLGNYRSVLWRWTEVGRRDRGGETRGTMVPRRREDEGGQTTGTTVPRMGVDERGQTTSTMVLGRRADKGRLENGDRRRSR